MAGLFGTRVAWQRVVAIATVQSAITLMWLVYRLYLGDMLAVWGYGEGFTAKLLLVELMLAIGIEPVFGWLSDRQQQFLGSRLPLITLGVILAAGFFLGLPLLVILGFSFGKVLFPGLAIAWALAMTMFRTPIMVLLLKSAPAQELPLAVGVLSMTAGLMALISGKLKPFLLDLGAINCFLLGSVVLLGASAWLRLYVKPPAPLPETEPPTMTPLSLRELLAIAVIGATIAHGSQMLQKASALVFTGSFGVTMNLLLALAALPMGFAARRWRNQPLMAIALGGLALLLWLTPEFVMVTVLMPLVLVLWVLCLATVKNGVLPFIFATVNGRWAGLAIGIYFGMTGFVSKLLPQFMSLEPLTFAQSTGILAFLVAMVVTAFPFIRRQPTSGNEV